VCLKGKNIESRMPKYRKRMTGNYAEKIPMVNVDEGFRIIRRVCGPTPFTIESEFGFLEGWLQR
jgi:hypothetical protein